MTEEKEIVKSLKALRLKKGLTAEELSLKIGREKDYISRVENEKAALWLSDFLRICKELGIKPNEFM